MIRKHISSDIINENQFPWYNYITIQVAGLHDMLTAVCNFINVTYLAKLYMSLKSVQSLATFVKL